MSDYGHCSDCGGSDGLHIPGCDYEGTGDYGGYRAGKGVGFLDLGLYVLRFIGVLFLLLTLLGV